MLKGVLKNVLFLIQIHATGSHMYRIVQHLRKHHLEYAGFEKEMYGRTARAITTIRTRFTIRMIGKLIDILLRNIAVGKRIGQPRREWVSTVDE